MDINNELLTNQVLLSILSRDYYNETLLEVLKSLKTRRSAL
jgi:predicted oxidoreductase